MLKKMIRIIKDVMVNNIIENDRIHIIQQKSYINRQITGIGIEVEKKEEDDCCC